MSYIDLKSVQAAGKGLLEQISVLRDMQEELKQTEQKIKYMAYMEETLYLLKRSIIELEEEARAMQALAECLVQSSDICSRSEQKIADTYNLEVIIYPGTTFGISQITGLDEYEHLLTFNHSG